MVRYHPNKFNIINTCHSVCVLWTETIMYICIYYTCVYPPFIQLHNKISVSRLHITHRKSQQNEDKYIPFSLHFQTHNKNTNFMAFYSVNIVRFYRFVFTREKKMFFYISPVLVFKLFKWYPEKIVFRKQYKFLYKPKIML